MADTTPKKKRKTRNELRNDEKEPSRKQMFRLAWLQEDIFKGWLTSIDNDPFHGMCKAFGCKLVAGRSELVKHSTGNMHTVRVKHIQKQHTISSWVKLNPLEKNVKLAEIRFAAACAEHDVSMKTVDHLGENFKVMFPDSEIAKHVRLHRTKCSSIIKNVLHKVESENLVKELNNTKFSICVDEGTDIGKVKLLAIVVRYFSEIKNDATVKLFEVISLNALDCSAEKLALVVFKAFNDKGVPLCNILGMAADNASVMVGGTNSLSTKLKEVADSSFIILKCICHSLHLASSTAASELPRNLEDFLKMVSSYFGHSSKRQAQLEELQVSMNKEKHKILRPADTRWLALQHCISRVLEQWEVLKLLFFQAHKEDRIVAAEILVQEMNNPFTKASIFYEICIRAF